MRQEDFNFSTKYYRLEDEDKDRTIRVEYSRGESGKEFIRIVQRIERPDMPKDAKADDKYHYINFPNIPVPEDAYRLINTMDGMVKYQDKYKPAIVTNVCPGLFYDYKLEIHSYNFYLQTMPKQGQNRTPRALDGPIPIDIFNWLQGKIREMLARREE